MTAAYVVLGVLALLALWSVLAYNALVKSRNKVDEAWSGIDVQLKRRHDLVPNLVETVKGYAAHERETLQNVTVARLAAVEAAEPAAVERAEARLTSALGGINALAEAYPDLKASESFQRLQAELAGIEDEIQAARRIYNSNVQHYNTRTQQFPTLLIAGTMSFTRASSSRSRRPPSARAAGRLLGARVNADSGQAAAVPFVSGEQRRRVRDGASGRSRRSRRRLAGQPGDHAGRAGRGRARGWSGIAWFFADRGGGAQLLLRASPSSVGLIYAAPDLAADAHAAPGRRRPAPRGALDAGPRCRASSYGGHGPARLGAHPGATRTAPPRSRSRNRFTICVVDLDPSSAVLPRRLPAPAPGAVRALLPTGWAARRRGRSRSRARPSSSATSCASPTTRTRSMVRRLLAPSW